MGRSTVQVEIVFLDVLAVIAFAVGQPEQALLENRILAVPERDRKTQPLLVVANSRKTVFPPAVGARAGLIKAEIVPGIPVVTVIFAHRPPLTLAQVRPPSSPRRVQISHRFESSMFLSHGALLGLCPSSRARWPSCYGTVRFFFTGRGEALYNCDTTENTVKSDRDLGAN